MRKDIVFTVMFVLWGYEPNMTRTMYITRGDRGRKFMVSRARTMSFLGACYDRQRRGLGTIEFHFSSGGWLYTEFPEDRGG